MATPNIEEYLKTIYLLHQEGGDVTTTSVADALDVSSPSVSKMKTKLQERGLVTTESYGGVALTDAGREIALSVLRRHRLLELFLTEELGYDLSEVHAEADQLEHYISETMERRLATVLDDPSVDPHGAPIPSARLELHANGHATLSEFEPGDVVTVSQVPDGDAGILEYLADGGITPGTELTVVDVAPFGMVTVDVAGTASPVALPTDLSALVRVERVEPPAASTPDSNGVV